MHFYAYSIYRLVCQIYIFLKVKKTCSNLYKIGGTCLVYHTSSGSAGTGGA